jgi:hypothetical protein
VWLVLRQLLIVLPLVAVAGAAGQTLLSVQILVISVLCRIPYQTFRLRLWILAYHQRACPDRDAYSPKRLADVASGLAAVAEVIPIQIIGFILWLVVTPSTEATLGFVVAMFGAVLSTALISTSFGPVLAHYYFDNRPDLRHGLAMLSALLLAFGVMLYAPTSIISLPEGVSTILDFMPWTAILFLPLSVGVAPVNWLGIGVSAVLTLVISAILWRLGRNARTDAVAWEPDYDNEDDDEM